MSFLLRALLGRRWMENPSTPLSDPDDWLYDSFGAGKSEAGVSVSRESALSVSAWWRGINLLSGDVAKMPPIVYRRDGKGAVHAVDHPAYQLLRYKPNPWMTSFTLWQTMLAHRLPEGNGYALVERDGAGRATALLH